MKRIPLRGRDGTVRAHALVDDEDYDALAVFTWHLSVRGYAARSTPRPSRRTVLMHRQLLPDAAIVDHANGDRLDNRRINLRACTISQNNCNRGPYARNRSGIKGVSYCKQTGRWRATVSIDGRMKQLGRFHSPEEAAAAYAAAATRLQGEFARTA